MNQMINNHLDNKVWYNSLSQYGHFISFFLFVLRIKNIIPQLMHLNFFGVFKYFVFPMLKFLKLNIINNLPILRLKYV